MPSLEAPEEPWVGWYRLPRQRWKPGCSGGDYDTCWRRLLWVLENLVATHVEGIVMKTGRKP